MARATRKLPIKRIEPRDKRCSGCGRVKAPSEYHANRLASDGLAYRCKPCANAATWKWQKANPERVASHKKAVTPKKRDALIKAARAKKPELYRLHNKASWAAWRARCMGQSITLTRAQSAEIRSTYAQARLITRLTGVPHEVDHIVPLAGKRVCGLHVPWNLEIRTRHANRKKSNTFKEAV